MKGDNLLLNPVLSPDLPGMRPFFPRAELAPRLEAVGGRARVTGNGDIRALGGWELDARLESGKWYKASVSARLDGVSAPEGMIFAVAAKHFLRIVKREGDVALLEQTFRHEAGYNGSELLLLLRACESGSAEFFDAGIREAEAPRKRVARVATVKFPPAGDLTAEGQRARAAEYLDMAGRLEADIAVLTEVSQLAGVKGVSDASYIDSAEEVPGGPYSRMLSEAARRSGMYVVAGLNERRGKYVYNTAALFGRRGEFVGRYAKTHLTTPELLAGVSCGGEYPIFELDFGKVALHICYDEWFPEVSRHYARLGAEMLILPVMGGKPITWRTRALDNDVYFVSSSANPPSMIIDSSGAILAQTEGGVAWADVDLAWRGTNAYVDPTLAYGMPCCFLELRNTVGWAP